ncbi:hypothetical protein BS78_10G162000 [Paspalum vaginatum]|nr:hypothetical protein BS78_10G162000 [Paspalum vaginatum]
MTSGNRRTLGGSRVLTWRERENNRRRERRRRAIATRIYAGLRAYGNYNLPKHCDNNEVLKALCDEAGWTVEADGTTYRKGCKPPVEEDHDQSSPLDSYNPSPASSSFPSFGSSSHITIAGNNFNSRAGGNSLIPWLKNLSSSTSLAASASKFPQIHHHYFNGGSISAPVTPPSSSPIHTPRIWTDWENTSALPPWDEENYASLPNSQPPSPGHHVDPVPTWLARFQIPSTDPSSPTYSLMAPNHFDISKETIANTSRMCMPGQSRTCSLEMGGVPIHRDFHMVDGAPDDFTFGSYNNGNNGSHGFVKAWEGERIHECPSDEHELELTLGSSKTRADPY